MPAKISAEERLATAKELRTRVNAKRIDVSELDVAKRAGRA